jgi:hypothetical protein
LGGRLDPADSAEPVENVLSAWVSGLVVHDELTEAETNVFRDGIHESRMVHKLGKVHREPDETRCEDLHVRPPGHDLFTSAYTLGHLVLEGGCAIAPPGFGESRGCRIAVGDGTARRRHGAAHPPHWLMLREFEMSDVSLLPRFLFYTVLSSWVWVSSTTSSRQ